MWRTRITFCSTIALWRKPLTNLESRILPKWSPSLPFSHFLQTLISLIPCLRHSALAACFWYRVFFNCRPLKVNLMQCFKKKTVWFWKEQFQSFFERQFSATAWPSWPLHVIFKRSLIFSFLAVHNSSIGDLVTHWLTDSVTFTSDITEWP